MPSLATFLLTFLVASTAIADVKLPGFFGDHMVIQREMKINVWGWADKGEKITVTLGDEIVATQADQNGKWKVQLGARKASKSPVELLVQGKNKISFSDILVGEVWLCSGQSNMEWPVRASTNAQKEIAAGNYPLIRHIKVPLVPSTTPQETFTANWQTCSPSTVGNFTACGYYMARKLYNELDIPIGLINSSWGGTRVEPWTPPIGFKNVKALQSIYQSVDGRTPGTDAYNQSIAKHVQALETWLEKAKGRTANETISPSPVFPDSLKPFASHQDPTMLYNGMINALVGYNFRGAIWYQGESNHTEGMLYFEKKKALINGWRELWGNEFPFYFVQIAPFQYGNEDPAIMANFWEAQAKVQSLPKTKMVVINDIATLNDIHPPNKQDVGLRLANLALKYDYGFENLIANSPELDQLKVGQGELRISFKYAKGGLKTRDGKAPSHFEVIGKGSDGYKPATARIDGESIVLRSEKVKAPVAFRFAWNKLAEPNLMGPTRLPVGAVRGGTEPDFMECLQETASYKLAYELDLAKLGAKIEYKVDNSSKLGKFDRVGYFLELKSDALGDQKVFVSMDAFTDDISKIGVPVLDSKAAFQKNLSSVNVFSNSSAITKGVNLGKCNIEFWPFDYGPENSKGLPGASGSIYDFSDRFAQGQGSYGSMQIHNHGARQTIFAINHWSFGKTADIGIGNSTGRSRDWTFKGNAASYSTKRLQIYVRPKN